MDMELMDMYRRPYSGLEMQSYNGEHHHQQQHQQHQHHQQHGQAQGQQYPFWNHHQLMALYQQHQQRAAAVMMGQGNMHPSKQTEPKPRLAKDEVELLEREFNKNPKPNSSTKRELAEQMGVEVPRINNWFQNRRAKEKQMRKTAEFEAQQASNRAASESKSSDAQDEGAVGEFYGLNDSHQSIGISTAAFGNDDEAQDNDNTQSERRPSGFCELGVGSVEDMSPTPQANSTPASSEADSYVHVQYASPNSPSHDVHAISAIVPPPVLSDSFSQTQTHQEFQRAVPYGFALSEPSSYDSLPASNLVMPSSHDGTMQDPTGFHSFSDREYFVTAPQPRFPSEMIAEGVAENHDTDCLPEQGMTDNLVKSENLSPGSMPDSPVISDLRFKSPPPSADIASRRNMRRPAPLGLTPLRSGFTLGPKTGIDAPRRSDTASPMRRISSATGSLHGRVQKPFVSSGGPRSPFALDRNKEAALLQNLQSAQSPVMTSLNSAMSPMSSDEMSGQCLRENTIASNGSDEEQGYTFSSLGAVGGLPLYKAEPSIKTPPGTPGLPVHFQDPFFNSADHAWSFVPQDEPLPTPSLCSHGGSELEFSMAPQLPGYVASQPVTPSFPPSIGPTYNGFYGANLANSNAEYTFPDSYPPESSARSSPGGPPRSKQFQFAQNITPQDFSGEK
ncbi:hypothetical protein B0H66DRAFT_49961 [Apodospora peruviana]|uniref:Homeobox domain-containing protein n=1 Tax=Apodospora peruviana TaxID=516989 RepID=A0AAE0ISE2_9PEZI|nr:hypothetical protein B0H66DRAFT_49961 [Apodospora peruviana]